MDVPKIEHHQVEIIPKTNLEEDRLNAMVDHINHTWDEATAALSGIKILYPKTKTKNINGYIVMTYSVEEKSPGMIICTHCVERAAMYLRDLANACDDFVKLAKETEAKATPNNDPS